MQQPVQITFRGLSHSDAVESAVREKAAKLERFYSPIISCRVMVEAEHRHHHKGNLYHCRIDIGVPGKELVVSRNHHDDHRYEDVYVAINDAFQIAERQLESYARKQRGDTKVHEMPPMGRVLRLAPGQDHGFIEAADGHEVYFHRHSVSDPGFDALEPGMEVTFSEETGDKGPQAVVVHVIGRERVAD